MLVLGNPWGLLALAGIPALVAIHFFRRQFRPLPVAGLFLWPPGDALPPAGRRRSRLETPLTLLVEILAALALTVIVSGARWETRAAVPHAVVVLDSSASMGALAGNGERISARAAREARKACEELGPLPSVRLTVILTGPVPEVAAGPAAPAGEALPKLDSWRPLLPAHSFGPALELAHRLSDAGGAIFLVTDQPGPAAEAAGPSVRVRGVGEPLPNVAITGAAREIDIPAGGTTVALRVSNFGPRAASRRAVLRDDSGAVLAEERLALGPGEERETTWRLEKDAPVLRARIEGEDALAIDDEAVLARPRPRNVRVRCDFPAGDPLRATIERACRAVPEAVWLEAADPEAPHLAIGPAGPAPAGWRLAIGTPRAELREGTPLDPMVGPYFADPAHPLMAQADLRGVIWSGAVPLRKDAPVAPLLAAGEVPLLYQEPGAGPPSFAMNIDLSRSNIHKSPAWPILFHNLVRLRQAALPGLERWNFRQGEAVRYRADGEAKVAILGSSGREVPAVRLRDGIEAIDTWRPGIYRVREGEGEDHFAVNFLDARESDLRGAHDTVPAPSRPAGERPEIEEALLWPWLEPGFCLLALAMVLLDLWLARRRAGVRP